MVVRDVAFGAGGFGFDSRADQIGHNAVNGSPPPRRSFGAVLPRRKAEEMGFPPLVTCFVVMPYREYNKDFLNFWGYFKQTFFCCASHNNIDHH